MALNHGQPRAMRKPIKRNAFYGVYTFGSQMKQRNYERITALEQNMEEIARTCRLDEL